MSLATLTNDLATGLGLFFVVFMIWALVSELRQEPLPADEQWLATAPVKVRSTLRTVDVPH